MLLNIFSKEEFVKFSENKEIPNINFFLTTDHWPLITDHWPLITDH